MARGWLDGKTVLITGAASGIGRASVIRAAQEGANVVGVDLSESGLESLRSDVEGQGGTFAYVAGSVEDLGVIDASIRMAVDQFGGLDCLVNNAGISGDLTRFDQFEVADFERMVAINQRSVWYGIKAAYAPMQERGGGSIVNVASMAGIRSNRNHCLYGMTKAAVISLTHHAAMDYASAKIRVNCLCPGPVETPMFDPLKDIFDEPGYRVARQRIQDRTVMDRFGAPEEQAAAIAFLLSEEASFITGIAMPVDGGWSVSDGQRR